jgi:fumarylacetoacetate (FAA) hydrolase
MKLVSYLKSKKEQLGMLVDGWIYDMDNLDPQLPGNMAAMLNQWDENLLRAKEALKKISGGSVNLSSAIEYNTATILAPVPHPPSCRDGYAFRQHVAAARKNRGVDMIAEFDEYPVFYFTNHNSVKGPGTIVCMPDHFEKLDFELEVAIVICRAGTNIKAAVADEYIGGLMIMNDLSARQLQMEEMQLSLGPAKGKDFATSIGPWLVTLDELATFEVPAGTNHTGKNWNLAMNCLVNNKQVSAGNVKDMNWTFAEIIERVSYGVDIYPGDIIGSGTVGTGCFLELNGTGKLNDPLYKEQWLKDGDSVEMNIDGLGTLSNTISANKTDWSILKQKKPSLKL